MTGSERKVAGPIVASVIGGLLVLGGQYLLLRPSARSVSDQSKDRYVITAHSVIPANDLEVVADDYSIKYGTEVLKVRYSESQTSSAEPGDPLGSRLHMHSRQLNADLSQVPPAGVPIRPCLMDQNRDKDGDLVIAVQPTPEPCMARVGDKLQYEPSPNGPTLFTYVTFDIISETTQ